MMVTRRHSASVSARMWLDSSVVTPRSRASATDCRKTFSINGSSPLVGSSSTSSRAFDDNAETRDTFWRLPLE